MAKQDKKMTSFVFVTGGVVSSLGKGITSACLGAILESRGLSISMIKLDPYINKQEILRIAINLEYTITNDELSLSDEVAIFPPVSGG